MSRPGFQKLIILMLDFFYVASNVVVAPGNAVCAPVICMQSCLHVHAHFLCTLRKPWAQSSCICISNQSSNISAPIKCLNIIIRHIIGFSPDHIKFPEEVYLIICSKMLKLC